MFGKPDACFEGAADNGELWPAIVCLFLTAGQPAYAQYITSKERCEVEVKNIKAMYATNNVGPKIDKVAAELIRILEDDCKAGKFERADELENAIRGLLVMVN